MNAFLIVLIIVLITSLTLLRYINARKTTGRLEAFAAPAVIVPLRDFAYTHKLEFLPMDRSARKIDFKHRVAGVYDGRKMLLNYTDGQYTSTEMMVRAAQSTGERIRIERRPKPTDRGRHRVGNPEFDLWYKISGPGAERALAMLQDEALCESIMLCLHREQAEGATVNVYRGGRVTFRTYDTVDTSQLDFILYTLNELALAVERTADGMAATESVQYKMLEKIDSDEGDSAEFPPSINQHDHQN